MTKLTKWERRRPVVLVLSSKGGWRKKVKIDRLIWIQVELAAKHMGISCEEFVIHAIKEAIRLDEDSALKAPGP